MSTVHQGVFNELCEEEALKWLAFPLSFITQYLAYSTGMSRQLQDAEESSSNKEKAYVLGSLSDLFTALSPLLDTQWY